MDITGASNPFAEQNRGPSTGIFEVLDEHDQIQRRMLKPRRFDLMEHSIELARQQLKNE